jgi:aminoglycoside phosphotransferase (APT) family kinase protein
MIYCSPQYSIETFLPGQELKTIQLSKAKKRKLYSDLGKLLRRMHSIPVKGYGEIQNKKGKFGTWDVFWENVYTKFMKEATKRRTFTQNELKIIDSFFDNRLRYPKKGRLLHVDIKPMHVLVAENKISGLIDFSDAMSGDPTFDFEQLYFSSPKELFEVAIRSHGGVDRHRLSFYILMGELHRIIHKKRKRKSKRAFVQLLREYIVKNNEK